MSASRSSSIGQKALDILAGEGWVRPRGGENKIPCLCWESNSGRPCCCHHFADWYCTAQHALFLKLLDGV
jgi:hypothetical protein